MPSVANTSQGPLGCGSYTVRLVNDGTPILESRRVTSVSWNRRENEPSTAVVVIPIQGTDLRACCEGANRIEPLRTEIIVERNGTVVWQGWLMRDVAFHRDQAVINAHDVLAWTERRALSLDHVSVGVDLTNIALAYLADINSSGDLPFVIDSTLTGVTADRTVLASEYRYSSDALRELYETGLDVTVIAGELFMGPEVDCSTITLRDTNFDGDPEIKLDGLQRATRVVILGANGIVAIYPTTPPTVCFHAADTIQSDENILDQNSADFRAQQLYEQQSSSHPYYLSIPSGSSMSPEAPVHINALIPGRIFQVYSQSLCLPIGMAMRLTAVDVDAAAGAELVRPTFEPIGDNQGD